MKIAQRFNAGYWVWHVINRPVGTAEIPTASVGGNRPVAHSYTNCLVHVVFSTKNRRNLIDKELAERLWPYLGGIARTNKMRALAVGGMPDHLHMLVSMPATIGIAKAVQLIKGGSSKWVHDTFPDRESFGWQAGYGAFSVGVSGVEDTIRYIENQEEHHRIRTFEDEFKAFLVKHGIEFDERYMFD